jgi:hypothetical protein
MPDLHPRNESNDMENSNLRNRKFGFPELAGMTSVIGQIH